MLLAVPVPLTSGAEATVAVPSMNVTVPPGGPTADVTVAERLTGCPALTVVGLADPVVVVAAGFTTWVAADEVLEANPVLPPYTAVRVWVPAASWVAVVV